MRPCLLIPIYDHPDTIQAVVEALEPYRLTCLIVDDGSGAPTRQALERVAAASPWVRLERHARNAGRGEALQTGYRLAARLGFSHVVQLDADGQHDASDVPTFLEEARRRPDALVLGVPVFDASAPLSRRIGRWVSRFWVWIETGSLAIRDPLCGFRCIPLDPVLGIIGRLRCGSHMEFDPEIAVRLAWAGTPIVSTPTRVRYPPGGISHFHLLRDNLRISRTHARLFLGMLLRLPRLLTRRPEEAPGARPGSRWYARPERGSKLGLRITVWAYRTLGRRIAALLLYPIVAYFFATDPAGRRASQRYLERVSATPQGARAVGDASPRRRVFRHYLEFGRSVLDRAGFWLGDRSEFAITIRGQEELDRVVEEKRGALVLGSHLGSFDTMRLIADSRSPLAVHVLMYTRHAARINAILDQLRGGMEARVIEVRPKSFDHVLESKERVERGEVVAILADRVPPGEVQRVSEVSFLGAPALLPQGPMKLAALLGCPVLLMFALRTGDRRYEVHVERFADRIELPRAQRVEALRSRCQEYADRLAAYCVQYPYQWFNFYDFWNEGGSRERI